MNSRDRNQTTAPIPNGWFAVAFSRDLLKGEVKRIRYFDQELVLFRTRSGQARVLDAYCAHLGAHLAEGGRVVGENIACPFHAWQYDGSGQCVEIPYCKKIPPLARVRGWEVTERNQLIFVWHHAEGKPPDWQVNEIAELADPDWTEPRSLLLEVAVHIQDMHENNNDPVHFRYVHGNLQVPPAEVRFGEGGRSMHMVSYSQTRDAGRHLRHHPRNRFLGPRPHVRAHLRDPRGRAADVLLHLPGRSRAHAFPLAVHGDPEPRRRGRGAVHP